MSVQTDSNWERILLFQIRATDLPEPVTQWRFHPTRRWRFDLAYPDKLIAIEVQGGIWRKGAHSSGMGITRDCEKACEATILGWRLMPVTPEMIQDGRALNAIERMMGGSNACEV